MSVTLDDRTGAGGENSHAQRARYRAREREHTRTLNHRYTEPPTDTTEPPLFLFLIVISWYAVLLVRALRHTPAASRHSEPRWASCGPLLMKWVC